MKNILPFMILMTGCGSSIALDTSPAWNLNNRYAVEMTNDCNLVKNDIGLSGCAFFANELKGNLILPAVYTGSLSFVSSNCKGFSQNSSSSDNVISIKEIYNATTNNSCEFQIIRTVTEKNMQSDQPMIGKFFIKILPDNQYNAKLQFSIGQKQFDGIGWYQRLYGKQDAVLKISTRGTKGQFLVMCGENEVKRFSYASNAFDLALDSNVSCNYELFAVNADSKYIELGTYMHQVAKGATIDVSVPVVTISSGSITFAFNDKDSSGKKTVVVGVMINDDQNKVLARCTGASTCKIANTKTEYIVKGFTSSLRVFYGNYNVATKAWNVKGVR